ncbi:MAG: histidine--tRNA ligase [Firmicutes bacterium]|nr:histidine--tRNA ligase [Bacillota bacterium]
MMIQKPKGTYDVYGSYGEKILYLEKLLNALMEKYHYEYVRTPIFEASNLFHRGVGETTDIVTKETYDFKDRGDRDMTLRPEGTAGVVRSFIENKMYTRPVLPVKTWYYGPMFRYERPQSGRFREFYQFGVEVFGSNEPMMDAEVISIPVTLFRLLGLKGIKVKINSLGDKESREAYREALTKHFEPHLDTLCSDCKERFSKNPLRILDCKVDREKDCMKNAPKLSDYYTEDARTHFEDVKKYLEALEIPYEVDEHLVRGLDYYTYTVFEVEADIKEFGSNNVLCAGGRYNHLVENLDGPSIPGVGFALGYERILNAIEAEGIVLEERNTTDAYIIPLEETAKEKAFALTQTLRMNGFTIEMDYMNRNLKGNFKQADRLDAKFVILIGEEEMKQQILTIKNNQTKEEFKIDEDYVVIFLDEKLEEMGMGELETCGDDCCCGHHDHEEGHVCHCNHEGGCHHE